MKNKQKVDPLQILVFNPDTGEIEHTSDTDSLARMLIWKDEAKKQRQIKRLNKYLTEELGEKIMVFQKMLEKASLELSFEDLRMLNYLMSICDFENWINISQNDLAKKIKTGQSNISRAINSLAEKKYIEIIKKDRVNFYRISPLTAYKGTFENHKKAIIDIKTGKEQ